MPSTTRDPWLDNAKMALVTLVVVGHAWTLVPPDRVASHLYDFVYAWHMPAFVLVTGYLSRTFDYRPDRLWQLVRTVAVPYVLFECLMALFRIHVGGEEMDRLFLDPHWPLWFLAALFCWRLLTPLFRPMWGGVALAVVLSVGAGLWAGDTLDIARVVGLLPFFVVGLKLTPERLELLRGWFPKVLGVVALAGIWWLAARTDQVAHTEWLYYRSPYVELDVSDDRAMLTRLAVLAIGLLGAFAFLALVPRRGGWFARMGAATLVVYLLHGFVVKAVEYTSFPDWAGAHPWAALAVTGLAGVALSLLLAAPPVASRLHHLVDPFGFAERRLDRAAALAAAASRDEALPPVTLVETAAERAVADQPSGRTPAASSMA
jgi:fucose 4-O-acetylase-like acetyltransferase